MSSPFARFRPTRCLALAVCQLALFVPLALAHGGVGGNPFLPADIRGSELADLAASADTGYIDFHETGQKHPRTVRIQDTAWTARLAEILRNGTYSPRSHCFCVAWPEIHLVREGRVILRLSVHHGEKLRISGEAGTGDYQVGATLGAAVNALANEYSRTAGVPKLPAPAPVPGS